MTSGEGGSKTLDIFDKERFVIWMQAGVSTPWMDSNGGTPLLSRRMHRGGGGGNSDFLDIIRTATSCVTLCTNAMNLGGICGSGSVPNTYGCDPYFLKCLNASSPTPLNYIRMQFASQESTEALDPALPQIVPFTNVSACLRIFCLLMIGNFY